MRALLAYVLRCIDTTAYQLIALVHRTFRHVETHTVLDITGSWLATRSRYASAVNPMSHADQRPTVDVQPCTARFIVVSLELGPRGASKLCLVAPGDKVGTSELYSRAGLNLIVHYSPHYTLLILLPER
jgi:hypothetical protein